MASQGEGRGTGTTPPATRDHPDDRPYPRVVRIERPALPLVPRDEEHYEATLEADQPRTRLGRLTDELKERLIGRPLTTASELGERLNKRTGLAIFSSDALSSSAYATEEILLILVLAGTGYLHVAIPIALAIALLLAIVVTSYQQTIFAYPQGGGAYAVARENLGTFPGLVAAAALMTDYVLTVAVSVSAGVLAIISAFPELVHAKIEIALAAVVIMTVVNLRGLRESGLVFAVPAYAFILGFGTMIVVGIARLALGDAPGSLTESAPAVAPEAESAAQALTLFLVLRAFSSGAVALSGVEAIANGVTAFRPPEARNAAVTMRWMALFLGLFLVGSAFLAVRFGIVPAHNDSVMAQIGRIAFGGENIFFYILQAVTALILILAANTAFAGFPRLASFLAQDRFLPKQFAFRGDRLAFSWGIITLGGFASVLLIAFAAETTRLIPLYAVGVFLSFTLSQSGMVVRWFRLRSAGWQRKATINMIGAVTTGVVVVIVVVTKFVTGAWIVTIVVPLLVSMLWFIHRDYRRHAATTAAPSSRLAPEPARPDDWRIIVAVGDVTRSTIDAITFARSLSKNVQGVHVVYEEGVQPVELEREWDARFPGVPLVVVESPFRSFTGPFLAYLDMVDKASPLPLMVIIPYVEPQHWWQRLLHNTSGARLHRELRKRPHTVIVEVPHQAADVISRT